MLSHQDFEERRPYVQARFDARYKVAANGCWMWSGAKERWGYGRFYIGNRSEGAHRASWMLHRGAIPNGLIVCHRCDTPACVNPDHLFCGTHADNNSDRSLKLRSHAPFGKGGRKRKLTVEQVEVIRSDNRSCAELARLFGIHPNTVSKIRLNRTWKHVGQQAAKGRKPRRYSIARGGFIVCRRLDETGGLISPLRPSEHSHLEAAETAAAALANVKGCEVAVFQQVASIRPRMSSQISEAA